jgi:hypothetical protein
MIVAPVLVRVLAALLLLATAVEAVRYTTLLLDWPQWFENVVYNGVLLGSAALCALCSILRRTERVAWALMALALALWASGELYWTFALADLEEAPYPSIADGLWLGFLPAAYIAAVLLVRKRIPHVDSRLWLDGVIGALTAGAVGATIMF